jgi:hypothetical protein
LGGGELAGRRRGAGRAPAGRRPGAGVALAGRGAASRRSSNRRSPRPRSLPGLRAPARAAGPDKPSFAGPGALPSLPLRTRSVPGPLAFALPPKPPNPPNPNPPGRRRRHAGERGRHLLPQAAPGHGVLPRRWVCGGATDKVCAAAQHRVRAWPSAGLSRRERAHRGGPLTPAFSLNTSSNPDPHPGNLIRTPDGRLAILDFGLMTEVRDGLRRALERA